MARSARLALITLGAGRYHDETVALVSSYLDPGRILPNARSGRLALLDLWAGRFFNGALLRFETRSGLTLEQRSQLLFQR